MNGFGSDTWNEQERCLNAAGPYPPVSDDDDTAYCDICSVWPVEHAGDICPDCRIDYCCVKCGKDIGEHGQLCCTCRREQLEERSARAEDHRDGLRQEKALGDARAILSDIARQWGRP